MPRLAAQRIDQASLVPRADFVREIFDGFRQRRGRTKILHCNDGPLRGFGKIHLKQNQLGRELIHRRQHHHDFAGRNLPTQILALRFLVDRLLRLRLTGVQIVKFTGRLEVLEDSCVIVVLSPRVADEQTNGIGRHSVSVACRTPSAKHRAPIQCLVRLLIYNIRYATGTGPAFHLPVPGAGYLRSSRHVLSRITDFIKQQDPDVVGLIEVDTGSIRTGMVNQADFIARSLGHYSTYECKYGVSSVNHLVPIVRKQANAFLAAPRVRGERFHYFDTGIKRLIIELELDDIAIFLVHLSLKFRHRQYQLRYLYDLVRKTAKPVIVAGDFNTYWGDHEIYLFTQAAGLASANTQGLSKPQSSQRA
jgi:endonuclease/exonuclease/phosphatase family metal-dependent hydrolase